jgi:putative ABC transport system ATP-binding protein
MTLIALTNLVKKYSIGSVESTVLKGVTLTVEQGEMVAIVGASGSGKSTLMNIIGLLDKPCSGDYWLQNRNIASLHEDELAQARNECIGFVFQQFNLLPRLTALQNIQLPLAYRNNLSAAHAHEQALQALKRVNMLAFAQHRPTQLSGGQQQRIAIARALVGNPQVILADEPTGALDSATGQEIMSLFLALHQEGRTLILITHDQHIAAQCQRSITLSDGNIIAESQQ